MKADIYKSKKKGNKYYFVEAGTKEEALPDEVKKECDTQKALKSIDLKNDNRIGVDSKELTDNILSNGYHEQETTVIFNVKNP